MQIRPAAVLVVIGLVLAPTACSAGQDRTISPEDHGARGDGITDDGPALQQALAEVPPGGTLALTPGRVYRHDDVMTVAEPGVTISGAATLLAGQEETSALVLAADGVSLTEVTVAVPDTTRRWTGADQMAVRIQDARGVRIDEVTVVGSAAAGIFVSGAHDFGIEDVSVVGTRADGVHVTGGSRRGSLRSVAVSGSGDDGVAVVSYGADADPVRDVVIEDSHVTDQKWGRGFSVVGGEQMRLEDLTVTGSAGACLYVASEKEYATRDVTDISVTGVNLSGCNRQAAVDPPQRPSPDREQVVQGAVLVYNSRSDGSVTDVLVTDVAIDGSVGAPQVAVRAQPGAVEDVVLRDFRIAGGPPDLFGVFGSPTYRTEGWVHDGAAVPDSGA